MELRYPALVPVGLVVAAAAAYAVYVVLRRRSRGAAAPVANSALLTALPEYQRAMRRHRVRTAILVGSAALLAGGALVGAARPVDTTVERPQTRNRDVVLCLDVSGSMADFDAELVRTFRALVTGFRGERIGLVIFNASAATVFPLTDDYDFIADELDTAEQALSNGARNEAFFAGTFNGRGTSLIGDGLATCVTSFDRADTRRPRSVVLATDNHLAGRPIVDLDEAAELAKAKGVRVYGLNPEPDGPDREAAELRQLVDGTGGRYYAMSDEQAIAGIVGSVQAQEAAILESAARALHTDQPRVPIALAGLGLLGVVGASRRWRR